MSSLNVLISALHVHALVCLLVFPLHADGDEPLYPRQAVHLDQEEVVTAAIFLQLHLARLISTFLVSLHWSHFLLGLLGLSFKQELTFDWLSKSEELLWSSYVATSDAKIYKASGINSSLEWTLCKLRLSSYTPRLKRSF